MVGEREAAPVVPIVEEDPYGGYVGIREVGAYLEMRPGTLLCRICFNKDLLLLSISFENISSIMALLFDMLLVFA